MEIPITRMRVSVTSRCNYQCQFCHSEGLAGTSAADELTVAEYETLARAGSEVGITEAKVLGGEALVRNDLEDIIEIFACYIPEVSLTTNGHGLDGRATKLRRAGLSRINVSVHSLNRMRYAEITGRDVLNEILSSLSNIDRWGFDKVQLNTTLLRGFNDHELPDFLDLASRLGIDEIQLIELQPSKRMNPLLSALLLQNPSEVLERLTGVRVIAKAHDCYEISWNGDVVTVSVLRLCNDRQSCPSYGSIQVTPEGYLKPCFWHNDNLTNIRQYLKCCDVDRTCSSILDASRKLKRSCTLYCQSLVGATGFRESMPISEIVGAGSEHA